MPDEHQLDPQLAELHISQAALRILEKATTACIADISQDCVNSESENTAIVSDLISSVLKSQKKEGLYARLFS